MSSLNIIVVVVALISAHLIYVYNKIAKAKNQVENSFSSLDSLLIKRSELIPNLVSTVQEFMKFEKQTFETITAMRSDTSKTPAEIDNQTNNLVKGIMLQVENYPELKSSEQFTNLQFSWNESEEQISAGRRYVSSSITQYNDLISVFPANIVASIFGFKSRNWEYATEEQQRNVSSKELFN